MRKVVLSMYETLDGVVEAPNTWHFPYFNEEMGEAVGEGFASTDAMLMGRVNYQEWAAYWPTSTDQPIAEMMNNIPSLRYISQLNDGALGNIEHQWHLIYIRWHATLGQLKVKYKELEARNPTSSFLSRWMSW